MDYKDGLALVHVAEETVGVDYRYFKEFSGYCITKEKKFKSKYKMYVRDLKKVRSTIIDKGFDKVLIKNNAYEKKIIEGMADTSNEEHGYITNYYKNKVDKNGNPLAGR